MRLILDLVKDKELVANGMRQEIDRYQCNLARDLVRLFLVEMLESMEWLA